MKRLLFVLVSSMLTFSSFAQEIDVRNVKEKEFPKYEGELWVRNPNGVDSNEIILTENDKEVKSEFLTSKKNGFDDKRSVLILVLNHQAYKDRTRWYKTILNNSIENGIIGSGDEFSVVSFDCNRPEYGDQEKFILIPQEPVFTSSPQELTDQVNAIDLNQKRLTHSDCRSKGDIYGAIFKALEVYGNHKTDLPKSIVVFADDLSLVTQVKEQGIIERSKELDIPIYGITYHQKIQRKYGVKQICDDSYGQYFRDPSNDPNAARDAFFDFVNVMPERAAGRIYPFKFSTDEDKTGEKETVKVVYRNKVATAFEYNSPPLNFFEWIVKNIILSSIIFLVLILSIVFIVVLKKKNDKIKEQEELRRQEEMAKIEAEQRANTEKVKQQDLRIQQMKSAEQDRIRKAEDEKNQEKLKAENERKLVQMRSRGNLPWFTFDHHGNKGSFEVNYPVFTIGRSNDNSYALNIPIVSSKHLKIVFDQGKYLVTDLGSTNGTYLNGTKISEAELRHGDVLILGDINLTFHI